MNPHDYLVSVDINMSLHEGNGLCEDIVACSNQVNIEHLMVSHNAEYSFVVVHCLLRREGNYDPGLRLLIGSAFYLREGKDIFRVSDELEGGWKIAVIDNVEQSIRVCAHLHLSKVN
jgi:hypothetical protein